MNMSKSNQLGGVIHTYQKYDPGQFPSPTQPPPDMASPALEHLLRFGSRRRLTEEELARAVRLDPSQIQGLGPSLAALMVMLEERKRKILTTYETEKVAQLARRDFERQTKLVQPPAELEKELRRALRAEQIRDLERMWYRSKGDNSPFARQMMQLLQRLGEKYQIEELIGKYVFTGHTTLTVPEALAVKEELEKIDELLKQLEEAAKTAQIAVIDLELLEEFTEPGDMQKLAELQQQVQNLLRELAEEQGLQREGQHFQITPKALRLFQSKLLERIFSD